MSEEVKDINETEVAPEAVETTETAGESASETVEKPEKRESAPTRPSRDNRDSQQRNPRFRRKVCRFCEDAKLTADYKNVSLLENFITDRGKILPRRVTGTCAKHQRDVAREIKRARIIALLPFIEK